MIVVFLAVIWLPATLRCEIGSLPGFELLGCATPCDGPVNKGCSDGCTVLEIGLVKISNDEAKAPPPLEGLLCQCVICLRAELRVSDPDSGLLRQGDSDGGKRDRTWQFVRRAAPPSRAPTRLIA